MSRRPFFALMTALTLMIAAMISAPLVVRAGGGCHGPDGSVPTEGAATVVKTDVCSFVPTISRVPVGTTVRFLNSDTVEHMVVGRNGTWASGILAPGAEFSATFKANGTFPYSCPIHAGMVGAIVVGTGVGVSGGAAIGQAPPVVPATAPSIAPTAAPTAAPSQAAASEPAPSVPAQITPATQPATQPATAAGPVAPTELVAVAVLAAIGGVLIGGLVGVALAGRRRHGAATVR